MFTPFLGAKAPLQIATVSKSVDKKLNLQIKCQILMVTHQKYATDSEFGT